MRSTLRNRAVITISDVTDRLGWYGHGEGHAPSCTCYICQCDLAYYKAVREIVKLTRALHRPHQARKSKPRETPRRRGGAARARE